MLSQIIAISIGASLGALLRWMLGLWLNPLFPTLPIGTLVANLAGGYLIGLSVAIFTHFGSLPAEARLFVITGFLGALTTFSTFSNEVVTLMVRGQLGWAITTASVRLAGSLTMTWLGLQSLRPFIRA